MQCWQWSRRTSAAAGVLKKRNAAAWCFHLQRFELKRATSCLHNNPSVLIRSTFDVIFSINIFI